MAGRCRVTTADYAPADGCWISRRLSVWHFRHRITQGGVSSSASRELHPRQRTLTSESRATTTSVAVTG